MTAWRVKVVPDDSPNADGEWTTIDSALADSKDLSFFYTAAYLERDLLKPGYHIVQYVKWRDDFTKDEQRAYGLEDA